MIPHMRYPILVVIALIVPVYATAQSAHPDDRYWHTFPAFSNEIGLIDAITSDGDDLYLGGRFVSVDGVPMYNCTRWDGAGYHRVGGQVGNEAMGLVHRIMVVDGDVFVAGMFDQVSGVWPANNVARWDGINWDDMDGGTNRAVRSLVRGPDGDIYVGGEFTTAGGENVGHIARWDGQQWHDLAGGMNQHVMAIAFYKGDLYAGGRFSNAGGKRISFLARFDGTEWHQVVDGLNGFVTELVRHGQSLYVGGAFKNIDGKLVRGMAKWDRGSVWRGFGQGFSGPGVPMVRVIHVDGNDVYAGGFFTHADGKAVNYIARWDGSTWGALGSGLDYTVKNMHRVGDDLYVTGEFENAGGKNSTYVARWNVPPVVIESFSAARGGGGVELNWERTLNADFDGYRIYRQGLFDAEPMAITGDVLLPSPAVSFVDADVRGGEAYRYTLAAVRDDGREIRAQASEEVRIPAASLILGQNAPNPFNPVTTIEYVLPAAGSVALTVFDVRGRRVRDLLSEPQTAGIKRVDWDGRNNAGREAATGVYFYRLETPSGSLTRKMTLLR